MIVRTGSTFPVPATAETAGPRLLVTLSSGLRPDEEEVRFNFENFPNQCRDHRTPDNANYLHVACYNDKVLGNSELFRLLTEFCPAAVREKNRFGQLPLHKAAMAASDFRHIPALQLLIDLYPDAATAKTIDGMTPLHLAVTSKCVCVEVVQTLLSRCPRAGLITDAYGQCPLHRAASKARMPLEVVQALHEANPAVIELKDSKGFLPIHWALLKSNVNAEVLLFLVETYVEGLLEADVEDHTPLMRYRLNKQPDRDIEEMLVDLTNYARDKIMNDQREAKFRATKLQNAIKR